VAVLNGWHESLLILVKERYKIRLPASEILTWKESKIDFQLSFLSSDILVVCEFIPLQLLKGF
jgi:hypothetical protein